jgi:hypothetical protein
MRHNPVIKAFYERLVGRGKSKKVTVQGGRRTIAKKGHQNLIN